ncbi:MAG TPA: DNA polymerase III subunit delta, partial [Candidatus Aveggerthella excrementigallinarum]|nr:DNA polymerase III subunit delta [Candidatus Aveggerthella excrementigallinarum]
MSDVFDGVFGQPQVREFLRASVSGDRVSHAYLFTGPAG